MSESICKRYITQTNVFYSSFLSIDIYVISKLKWFVKNNSYSTKNICNPLLSSESNSKVGGDAALAHATLAR